MKEIKLSKGFFALVDDEDFDFLSQWKWHAVKKKYTAYAQRICQASGFARNIKMHRAILGLTNPKIQCDHRDMNGLNNQRSNLRICTQSENEANKIRHKKTSSQYFGVCWDKKLKKWRSRLFKNGETRHSEIHDNELDAAIAYNNAAKKYHGEFARTNI